MRRGGGANRSSAKREGCDCGGGPLYTGGEVWGDHFPERCKLGLHADSLSLVHTSVTVCPIFGTSKPNKHLHGGIIASHGSATGPLCMI